MYQTYEQCTKHYLLVLKILALFQLCHAHMGKDTRLFPPSDVCILELGSLEIRLVPVQISAPPISLCHVYPVRLFLQCSFVPRLLIEIETTYENNNGNSENVSIIQQCMH